MKLQLVRRGVGSSLVDDSKSVSCLVLFPVQFAVLVEGHQASASITRHDVFCDDIQAKQQEQQEQRIIIYL